MYIKVKKTKNWHLKENSSKKSMFSQIYIYMTSTLKVPACQINILDLQTIFGINIVKTQFSSLFPEHTLNFTYFYQIMQLITTYKK